MAVAIFYFQHNAKNTKESETITFFIKMCQIKVKKILNSGKDDVKLTVNLENHD